MWYLVSPVGNPTLGGSLYLPLGVSPLGIFGQGQEGISSFERVVSERLEGYWKEEPVV